MIYLRYYIYKISSLNVIFTQYLNDFWHTKYFDPYNVFLAISTSISMWLSYDWFCGLWSQMLLPNSASVFQNDLMWTLILFFVLISAILMLKHLLLFFFYSCLTTRPSFSTIARYWIKWHENMHLKSSHLYGFITCSPSLSLLSCTEDSNDVAPLR